MPSGILRFGPFGIAKANPNCKVMGVKYSSCSRKCHLGFWDLALLGLPGRIQIVKWWCGWSTALVQENRPPTAVLLKMMQRAVLLKMMQRESPFHYNSTKVLQILRNFKFILVMGLLFFSSFSSDVWGREACLVLCHSARKIIGKHKFMDPRMAGWQLKK